MFNIKKTFWTWKNILDRWVVFIHHAQYDKIVQKLNPGKTKLKLKILLRFKQYTEKNLCKYDL